MTASAEPGSIITFYSYKGGTGRSMALANIGCLLALRQAEARGRGVLLVDWDLEAPGLHRFFRGRLYDRFSSSLQQLPLHDGAALSRRLGLIDLFWELTEAVPAGLVELTAAAETGLRGQLDLRRFVLETDIEGLHVLKAGRFDQAYPLRVTTFDWAGLYRKAPWALPWFCSWIGESYEYVLIDSRTGITDTSGICTMLLPEKLVVVFTPNRQSTEGALAQIEAATDYRRRSDDLRPLTVYPLPSRIEAALPALRDRWREDPDFGYQPRFEALFKQVYGLPVCDLTAYFDNIQIAQVADYAYGEEIAVLAERHADKFSLTSSYRTFTDHLLSAAEPWEKPEEVKSRAAAQELLRRAKSLESQLPPAEIRNALRALTRLVQVAAGPEVTADGARRARLKDIEAPAVSAVPPLVASGLVREVVLGNDPAVELVDAALLKAWPLLGDWIEEHREGMLWRQRLDDAIAQWRSAGRGNDLLLRDSLLARAQEMALSGLVDLNLAEQGFIEESSQAARERERAEEERKERERVALAAAAGAARRGEGLKRWARRFRWADLRRVSGAPLIAAALACFLGWGAMLANRAPNEWWALIGFLALVAFIATYPLAWNASSARQRQKANYAFSYLSTERWPAAEKWLRRASREVGEQSSWIYGSLGFVLRRRGQSKQADKAFAKALAIDPDLSWVRAAKSSPSTRVPAPAPDVK
jgi:Mrp family chromosome partitioning ATPase